MDVFASVSGHRGPLTWSLLIGVQYEGTQHKAWHAWVAVDTQQWAAVTHHSGAGDDWDSASQVSQFKLPRRWALTTSPCHLPLQGALVEPKEASELQTAQELSIHSHSTCPPHL